MAAEAAGDEAAAQVRKKLTFLDLPAETQEHIIAQCPQADLICVALVSKHFHELASAQLYRNFHIIFPDDDDLTFDSPIDGLAGGLDTFTTSDYNYAKHLKDLSMDTLSAGVKGELSYQSYLYSASCGKFLNTLLYLTLKKARSLEAFRWNIRVELSRPVYRELHRIPSLTKLHIRMQAGESYYMPPPPLPMSTDMHPGDHSVHWSDVPTSLSPPAMPSTISLPLTTNPPPIPSGPPPALVPPSKSLPKSKASRRGSPSREPSTLSGFKNLKSLSVLDIDDLDIVTELKTCVKNSSSTLNELQLSLSDSLALQARKPPPDSDPDDSDVDDEFQVVPTSHNHGNDGSGPAKAFRAQEERKVQEAVLGRIFDVEHLVARKPPTEKEVSNETSPDQEAANGECSSSTEDPRELFITSIRSVSDQLMTLLHGSGERPVPHQEILDTIEKAARKYVETGTVTPAGKGAMAANGCAEPVKGTGGHQPSGESSSNVSHVPDASAVTTPPENESANMESKPGAPKRPNGLTASKGKTTTRGHTPLDDIDMEHIETINDVDAINESDDSKEESRQASDDQIRSDTALLESTEPSALTPPDNQPSPPSAIERATSQAAKQSLLHSQLLEKRRFFKGRLESLESHAYALRAENKLANLERIRESEKKVETFKTTIVDIDAQISAVKMEMDRAENQATQESQSPNFDKVRQCIRDYVRETRGFSLEKLSVHLIPVKASVLSRAVNLRSLKQLTLLNVGNQTPIWTLLSKENKVHPLPLRSVYTDNVSGAFLSCMSQLTELHELFMLERNTKYRPESFAPRSTTSIDQIRRLVLSKHMPTLKRLMIKDESNNSNWDANEKAMIHICNYGRQLEELAVSMNIQAVHAFMQYFSGLVNLRALHILHFKNNDTCIWVMREIRRFIVDNLSHHPELKLEWIAMEDEQVDRVIRATDESEQLRKERNRRNKGKGKAPAMAGTLNGYPVLPSIELDSESESEDELFNPGTRLRFKTVGPMPFYDVWGVKIFEKEIRSGRL